jgi:hypothetical protein
VKITELLAEVDQWTSLGDRFLHLRTQAPPKNRQALLTAVLADGINLGCAEDPELRRRSQVGLNKGEQQNALRRAVFFNRLGEIRDRSFENQRHRASGLNLIVAAIILWNTTYLQRAIDHLRKQGHHPVPGDLVHLSPLEWEHINLTGLYPLGRCFDAQPVGDREMQFGRGMSILHGNMDV